MHQTNNIIYQRLIRTIGLIRTFKMRCDEMYLADIYFAEPWVCVNQTFLSSASITVLLAEDKYLSIIHK